jgi:hypothetical protein
MRKITSKNKNHSKEFVFLFVLILLLLIYCPAYASRADDPADTNTNELLTDRDNISPGRWHGYVGAEINYAENIVNYSPRGELVPLYFLEYDRWTYIRNTGGGEIAIR